MIGIKRHQAVLCILVSILVYGLTWYGVMLTLNDSNATKSFNFSPVRESPFNIGASFVDELIVWQINEANLSTIDKVSEQKSGKVAARNPGDEKISFKHGLHVKNYYSTQTRKYSIDYPDTVFMLTGVTNYQIADIPPPYISAS